jgi:membrane protein DedA with SNARE-associated domain
MDILEILIGFFSSYGYAAVFGVLVICGFGIPIPEDITLVSGGVISGLGYTDPHIMFAVGMAGVMFGDSFVFLAGSYYGEQILQIPFVAKIVTKERYSLVQKNFAKYGKWVVFVARFMPGLRMPIYISAGISQRISFLRFFIIDFFAALVSVPIWVYLCYFGASERDWLVEKIGQGQTGIFIFLGIAILIGIFIYIKKKKSDFWGAG